MTSLLSTITRTLVAAATLSAAAFSVHAQGVTGDVAGRSEEGRDVHRLPRHPGLPEQLPRNPQGADDLGPVGRVHRVGAQRLQKGRPQAPHHARHRRFADRAGHGRSGRVLRLARRQDRSRHAPHRQHDRRRADRKRRLRFVPRRQLQQADRPELPQAGRPARRLPLLRAQGLHGRRQQGGGPLQRHHGRHRQAVLHRRDARDRQVPGLAGRRD